jgi:hypothetical protein
MSGPRRSLWRFRSFGCLGAVLLVVLLAAVGMPTQPAGWIAPNWIAHHHVALRALREERLAHPQRQDAVPQLPAENALEAQVFRTARVLPRTRSILDRGLPPPRAPCA